MILRSSARSSAVLLKKEREPRRPRSLLKQNYFVMSYPHLRQPTVRVFNRKASEGSSMKNPEKFKAFSLSLTGHCGQ
jgi:hypothetical protein